MSETNEQKNQVNNSSGGYADQIIEGHSYDGIVEYDNPMPLWWKAVFLVTIVWTPIYILGMEMGYINTYQQSLHDENVYWTDVKEEYRKSQPELTPERISEQVQLAERIEPGKTVFATNCAACHGDKGEGLIGPNLTDKFWLHGGSILEIFKTIDQGVLEKGMPAWGSVLSPEDILNVEAFIISIRNTEVPGKAPEGDPYVEDGDGDAEGAADEAGSEDAETEDADDQGSDENAQADADSDDGAEGDENPEAETETAPETGK